MTDRIEFDIPLSRLALLRKGENPRVVSGLWFCPDYSLGDTLCIRVGRSRAPCTCRFLMRRPDGVCVLRFNATVRTRSGLKWIRFCRESNRRPSRTITRRLLNMLPRAADQPPLLAPDYGKQQAALLASLPAPDSGPRISVLMPVFDPPLSFLAQAIASVRAQTYSNWELCIADDCSTNPSVRKLLQDEALLDSRIKIVFRSTNGHISAASNSALALASGEWCAPLDQDDELAPPALAAFVSALKKHPDAALAYSDEDKICVDGKRFGPFHKPAWMPELLLGQNFVSHLGFYRADRLRALGGFREGYEGCQDWDLVLRYTRDLPASRILHLPFVLYHWRVLPGSTAHSVMEKPYVIDAAGRTVRAALDARSLKARLTTLSPGQFRVELVPEGSPAVTVHGLDNPADQARLKALSSGVTLRFAPSRTASIFDPGSLLEFAQTAATDTIVLMTPELLPRDAGWLGRLVAAATQAGVAAAGGRLIDAAGRVIGGSLGMDATNRVIPSFENFMESDPGYYGRAHLMHNPDGLDLRGIVLRRDYLLRLHRPPRRASGDPMTGGWLLCTALRAAGARLVHDPGVQFDLVSPPSPAETDKPECTPSSARQHHAAR